MKTTLNQIRECGPCESGWKKLLAHLGKTKADDEPLSILTVLESNGFDDALWCLRAVKGRDREIRLYAVWCARQVQHLNTDPRVSACIDVAERFADGEATDEEMDAARAAAWTAAGAAAGDAARDAAVAAAWTAARAAAGAAAWTVAGAAAWTVAVAAAWTAAGAAAGDAAGDAAWAAQKKHLIKLCKRCEAEK